MQFLLTCLLRGMTPVSTCLQKRCIVSTHMPLARHDILAELYAEQMGMVSTHMPLARHDPSLSKLPTQKAVSTHMPLARHDTAPREPQPLLLVSTHMPLARHDDASLNYINDDIVSTHMPLARHDGTQPLPRSRIYKFLLTCLLRGMTC